MTESIKKSLYKTVTWRIVATTILFLTALLITKSWPVSAGLISIDFVVKTVCYYLHERAWSYATID